MTADEVVVLAWSGIEQPIGELTRHVSDRIAAALRQGSAARVCELTVGGEAIDLKVIPRGAVIFPVAVGAANSGWLQRQLEMAGHLFIGSGSAACEAANDIRALGPMLIRAGIRVAPHLVCNQGDDLTATAVRASNLFPLACIVRPTTGDAMRPMYGGDSVAHVVANLEDVLSTSAAAVIEASCPGGRRFYLASLHDGAQVAPLPAVEVIDMTAGGPVSFYSPQNTAYVCPALIAEQLRIALNEIAVAVHCTLGCVTSLVEVYVADDGSLTVGSCAAVPLLFPSSLFVRAAAGAGMNFNELVRRLVDDARRRIRHPN